jgi:FkbM family methyltransferase
MKNNMKKRIGRTINKLLHPFGYMLAHSPKIIPSSKENNWANNLNIQTIIDIGSNKGQFIKEITKLLPGRKIVAFEPIRSCYEELIANTKQEDILAYNIGLSDNESAAEINISKNSGSSSILEMENLHKLSFPDSYYIGKEKTVLKKLDEVLNNIELPRNILIKMYVQGFEKKVIR